MTVEKQYERVPIWMRGARRWLLWIAKPKGAGKPAKVPYYTNGRPRTKTDSAEDLAQLAEFSEALSVSAANPSLYSGLGFALGPDGTGNCWQGVDFDDFANRPNLRALAQNMPGYTELSPSQNGAKSFGYGPVYPTLSSNSTGIEAYAGRRFFTVTGLDISSSDTARPVSLAEIVSSVLIPLHGSPSILHLDPRPAISAPVEITNELFNDLMSALESTPADDYGEWIANGQALHSLGDTGFFLWVTWSAKSAKFRDEDISLWQTFRGERTNYPAVFKRAEKYGWKNPRQKRPIRPDPSNAGFGLAPLPQVPIKIDPFVPPSPIPSVRSASEWVFELHDPLADADLPAVTYRDERRLWPDSQGLTVTQVIAEPKCHKTNWIMAELFRLAITDKARVLMLSLEGGYGVRTMRLQALAKHYSIPLEDLRGKFQIVRVAQGGIFDLSDYSCVQAFISRFSGGRWTDVVIDTQHRAAGSLEENSATDARKLWNAVEEIRSITKVNVVLVHHKGKDSTRGGRGSSADLASVDQQIELSFDRTALIVKAKVTARKDGVDGIIVPFKVHHSSDASVPILIPISDEAYQAISQHKEEISETVIVNALRSLHMTNGRTCSSKELAHRIIQEQWPEKLVGPIDRVVKKTADQLTKCAARDRRIVKFGQKKGEGRRAAWRWTLPDEDLGAI